MKLSILLPILAAGQNKRLKKKKEGNRSVGERFVASDVTAQCLSQVPNSGGSFQVTNNGSRGEIRLENYTDNTTCKHVVQAEQSCTEIRINYRSVAVEEEEDCGYDSFRFGWTGTNGFDVTPSKCHCFGDGCSTLLTYEYENSYYDYTSTYEYEFGNDHAANIGPDSITVNANTFTFFFRSDSSIDQGHVILDWECVGQNDYTTTTRTTTLGTTTTR